MLNSFEAALRQKREADEAALAQARLDGIMSERRQLGLYGPHPYGSLDVHDSSDQRLIASLYARMARR